MGKVNPPGDDKPLYILGAIFFGAAWIGSYLSTWDAGREYGIREERRRAANDKDSIGNER